MNCEDLAAGLSAKPLAGWQCSATSAEFLRLLTPFRYPDGGVVELYVEQRGNDWLVTDYGETLRFLHTHGIDPARSPSRKQLIDLALELGGAVDSEGNFEVLIRDPEQILSAAVRLGQIVTGVGDLSLSAKGVFGSTFSDALEEYLKTVTRGAEVQRSGVLRGRAASHQIDIVVRTSRGISAIEGLSTLTPTGANAQTAYTIQKFADLAALGPGAPNRFAVLDNSTDVWSDSLRRQLENFSIVVDWERRDNLLAAIGAQSRDAS